MKKLYLETVDSTNKWAKEHILEIEDKTIVYTFNQTAGRGRLNRAWNNTGEDNIYASIVLKPSDEIKAVYSNLTQYLCVILAKTFEEYNVVPQIKWPNDIQINGKKISGILAEGVNSGKKLEGLVLGVGINLNTSQDVLAKINQPATSLNIETGFAVDKNLFLNKLSDSFCLLYDKFIEEGFPLIRDDYIKRANFLDKQVAVKVFDKTVCGVAKDVTENGCLEIVDSNNKIQTLWIGDIL